MSIATNDGLRLRQLIDSATRAAAAGQKHDAERLFQQARAEAPRDPGALNELARAMLSTGNPAGAHDVLRGALELAPSERELWLNLAAALRGLGRPDEELSALDMVLGLDPHNVRALLQKGSVFEIMGRAANAAEVYSAVLRLIPPGTEPPPAMREVVAHARAVVAANSRALESFLDGFLRDARARYTPQQLGRFDRCLETLLLKKRVYRQQPTFMYFPEMPAIEFYAREAFPWLDSIEAAVEDIQAELFAVLADGPTSLEPYVTIGTGQPVGPWASLNRSRKWGVYYFWRDGVAYDEHIARCPRTVEALKAWPRCDVPGCGPNALFSILDAKTRIPPHTGVANTRLIVHLPLVVPPGCGFRVGGQQREWIPGQAFVFDDTIEHEAWNDGDEPRAVMIFDIWSPNLSEAERELVRAATAGVGKFYGMPAYRDV